MFVCVYKALDVQVQADTINFKISDILRKVGHDGRRQIKLEELRQVKTN